ncbi:histidine phosphatase family protein [Luteimonas aquatica]|uniref:histidine phosphatase family protein n=1 Tax=Luteimonas aquatica TaxID=450364 RepID=UPI001F57CACE|nr:histidine phosphatase family protein [Luteimonas aquatica]
MADLLLIRHGQASFGAADYDRLSDTGEEQSRRLGAWLARCGVGAELVATGRLHRHARTAELCLDAAGLAGLPRLTLAGLDELDHVEVLKRHRPDLRDFEDFARELRGQPDPHRAFQRMFAEAVARWSGGRHDHEYERTWPAFRRETLEALQALAEHPARGIWAFTSGGPIAVIATELLGAPVERTFALSWNLVNTGITRVRLGRGAPQLITYNAWPHLAEAADAALITYR